MFQFQFRSTPEKPHTSFILLRKFSGIFANSFCWMGFCDANLPGTEKLVIARLEDKWLSCPKHGIGATDVSSPGLLGPESVMMVKGWNCSCCLVYILMAAHEYWWRPGIHRLVLMVFILADWTCSQALPENVARPGSWIKPSHFWFPHSLFHPTVSTLKPAGLGRCARFIALWWFPTCHPLLEQTGVPHWKLHCICMLYLKCTWNCLVAI